MSDDIRAFGGSEFENEWSKLEKAETTQQHDTDDDNGSAQWHDPPYNPRRLAKLLERHETHKSCVSAKAQGVAGYGLRIVPHPEVAGDDDPPGEETIRNFWFGAETDFLLGPDRLPSSASSVLQHTWSDREAIGWGIVELLVNPITGKPTGLAHIPAHTIRSRDGEPGYVQLGSGSEVKGYFSVAGARYGDDKRFIDTESGEVASTKDGIGTVANELLMVRNYSALHPHYGLPDIIPGLQTLAGDIAARKYQTKFFENDGVPRFAVVVEGGELTDKAWNQLKKKFKKLSLEDNSHRGVLIEAVSNTAAEFGEKNNVNIRIEPLTVGVKEEMDFIEYRKENEHSILQAHSVPPVVANRTEGVNYANAKEQRQEFAQTTVKPRQEAFAAQLYNVIHRLAFGIKGWMVEFELHGGQNKLRESEIAVNRKEAAAGTRKVNEARQEIGLDPLEGPEGKTLVSTLSSSKPTLGDVMTEASGIQRSYPVGNQGGSDA